MHEGPVSCVDVRADGLLASGGYDGNVLLWGPDARPIATLTGHRALVNGVRFSADGALLVSASSDHTARLWDVARRELLAVLEGHRDDVNQACFSPDGARIATASFDGAGRVWSASTGRCLAVLLGHQADLNAVAWSPDGRLIATASDDRSVRLFTPEGEPRGTLAGHGDWVDEVAWSPDGKLLASASLDRTVRVWDVASGACVATLCGHGCTVKGLAWSPDGARLATAAYDKRIRIFAREGFEQLTELHDSRMWNRRVAWAADGTLATGSFGRAPVLWRLDAPRAHTSDRVGTPGINGMALAPDGGLAALACDDGGGRIVELETGRLLRASFDSEAALLCAAWSPHGATLAFGGWDDRVALYAIDRARAIAWIPGHGDPVNAIAFARDGRALALGSFMGSVSTWDPQSGALLGEVGRHQGSVKAVAALPGGGWISCGRDGHLRMHDTADPRAIEVAPTILNAVAVSPDGTQVACAGRGCGVQLYDLARAERTASFQDHRVSARTVAFSDDGTRLAAGYYDGHLLSWSPAGGRPLLTRPFGPTPISSVAFLPGANALAVATWDPRGRFGLVDARSGELLVEHALAELPR
jgi:WD40 repeat protein